MSISKNFTVKNGITSGGTVTAPSFSGAGTGLTGTATALNIGGTATNISGIAAIANGGTGASTASSALLNLGGAPLNSPVFTGTPSAPTPATGDNSTSLATTAFVKSLITSVQSGAVTSADKWTYARTIALTGDLTASFTLDGSANVTPTLTLATVNTTTGSFGNASSVASFTVNGKGLITAATTTPIQIAETQITNGALYARLADTETVSGTWTFSNPVSGVAPTAAAHFVTKQYVDNANASGGTVAGNGLTQSGSLISVLSANTSRITVSSSGIDLADVNTNVGTFGSTAQVPVITVNSKGIITSVSTTTIVPTGITAISNGGTGASSASVALTNLGAAPLNAPIFTGNVRNSVASITSAGTTQSNAAILTSDINLVSGSGGVILVGNIMGASIVLINTSSNTISVYPPSTGQIDGLGANTAFNLSAGAKIMFIASSSIQYYTLNATYA